MVLLHRGRHQQAAKHPPPKRRPGALGKPRQSGLHSFKAKPNSPKPHNTRRRTHAHEHASTRAFGAAAGQRGEFKVLSALITRRIPVRLRGPRDRRGSGRPPDRGCPGCSRSHRRILSAIVRTWYASGAACDARWLPRPGGCHQGGGQGLHRPPRPAPARGTPNREVLPAPHPEALPGREGQPRHPQRGPARGRPRRHRRYRGVLRWRGWGCPAPRWLYNPPCHGRPCRWPHRSRSHWHTCSVTVQTCSAFGAAYGARRLPCFGSRRPPQAAPAPGTPSTGPRPMLRPGALPRQHGREPCTPRRGSPDSRRDSRPRRRAPPRRGCSTAACTRRQARGLKPAGGRPSGG
mmetsp:Transcript_60989/g.189098  ORF Transcript_60989/g.189098 Transcript_60989/m.189098 type:complete len:348 (-) Transcript_60989:1430-2473(-)